ncbi:MAG: OmpH family outer membrane protein [Chitinophagaceae bacterium]|nr:OmpH family outer membrane protein [Chitinophagaceae bacterium]
MNQKVINIVLALGVAVALFLQFKAAPKQTSAVSANTTATTVKLGYVDLDSVQEKYLLYKEQMDLFEKKKEAADRDLNNAFQKIDNERIAFAKRGESITQAEYENFQRSYQAKMQNLEEQKRVLENNIATEGMKTMENLKKNIDDYLVVYNKEKAYSYIFSYSSGLNVLFYKDSATNITDEIVAGLNAEYNKTKKGK